MQARPPVRDWLTDFDHLDPRWIADPFPIWDEIRTRCPVAHTDRFNGVYLPTRYEDVKTVAYDTEHFSSKRIIVRDHYADNVPPAPPITSDPPEHRPARMVLLPAFTPAQIDKLEDKARAVCNMLIDRIAGADRCDGAVDYSQHIPVRVIAHMLGVSEDDGDLFREWIELVLTAGVTDPAALMRGVTEMTHYFVAQIAQRKAQPGDDLISFLLNTDFQGRKFDEGHVLGSLRLLLIAGIDTTWSAIGSSLWHLATHPQDRQRLVAEPELIPTAIEEFLRAYAPVTMARLVKADTEIGGCPMKAGQMVMLSFPAANRDPAMFPDADKVIIDRQQNRHAAFGLGIHRCVGSNLARMEMTVAVQEWLKRMPGFSLDPSLPVEWSTGTVRGPRKLPLLLGVR
ncbi:MAG TPA: cytochrome P450 [Burkholderiaceae bacterium]|nr:cytochrome P450 [Burkholderiaceae bacterium]